MVLLENKTQEAGATLLEGKTQDESTDMPPPTFRRMPNLVEPPQAKKKKNLGFEYAEHCYLGDAISLTLSNGSKVLAKDHSFALANNLSLTYGQINALAGDFYGTFKPICQGNTQEKQKERFIAAYNTLAGPDNRPQETGEILAVLSEEVDAVNRAIAANDDPSVAYSQLPDMSAKFQAITLWRFDIPRYWALAETNFDHFGQDAVTAYNAGHSAALAVAVNDRDLEKAYSMNAFADHFLEDLFSAGHLRTPRQALSDGLWKNVCAKFMHDEENAIGLTVRNPAGEAWKCFGDKRALDHADSENQKRCLAAVQASAAEIYDAWKNKTIPAKYGAWAHAPTLESVWKENQHLSPLFLGEKRRNDLENRRQWDHSIFWVAAVTAAKCQTNGWWNYPITIDGPTGVVNGTAIATTATTASGDLQGNVYYQNAEKLIVEKLYRNGRWTDRPGWTFRPKLFSPLAATSLIGDIWPITEPEFRVYCISTEGLLEEWCNTGYYNGWTPGTLSASKVRPAYNTKLAAVRWDKWNARVFVQDKDTNAIQEYTGLTWQKGATLPVALSGTSIAATSWTENNKVFIRVYYQAADMTLKEHCWDSGTREWIAGGFTTGKMPPGTSIATVKYRVYCQDGSQNIVGYKCEPGSVWSSDGQVTASLPLGGFSSAFELNGKRFYYQADDNRVCEQIQSNGQEWTKGSVIS